MGHRGQKFNSLGDLFTATQNQFDGMSQRITDLTDFVWENLPVEFPEIPEAGDGVFPPIVVIAAVDAPTDWIAYASASPYGFVCDGAEDEVQFQEAEDVFGELLIFSNSMIWLSPGNFNITPGFLNAGTGTPWGNLVGRYLGHDTVELGFTNINVDTGWATIPEVDPDTFPGQLVTPLSLFGRFEHITFNFIPDAVPDGDLFFIASAGGELDDLTFNIGSGFPPAFTVATEVALGLSGATNCRATVYRQGIDPTDFYAELDDVTDFTLLGAFDGSSPDPLSKILHIRGMCNDITMTMANDYIFDTDQYPIQIDGEASLSNVSIFGDFDWTGVDGIVQINPSWENSSDSIVVDVSSFLVASEDHPRIFFRDALFEDITNLGSRVLHGETDQRPPANMCIGTVYINTDNPAAPVLEWSDGTTWWQSAAMT